ncbi:unnamed protein product [Clonostachys rosea]|uniref:Uncharacterized protein n=1 Tax=Bionectria ochroleuca TaxID=29856 RepID=A0ABY6UTY3_BIOOC|nr:unnamed protein product [Clonostachys rosea]
MILLSIVKQSNKTALPAPLRNGIVAVFLGATSGIGQSALKQFVAAAKDKNSRIYIVGRSTKAASPLLDELRHTDSSASIGFIERDVSLLREVDLATDFIKQRVKKVDLLFLSVGFISFEGRKETSEGLEPSMTTRFYSRARAIHQLLPLLDASDNPHVTNILAGGEEGSLLTEDLDLKKPENYSIVRAAVHSATMLTLTLERYAKEYPRIGFVHAHPGLVSTPIFGRGSSGISGLFLRSIAAPLVTTFLATSAEDAGARALFHATNARYTVDATMSLATPMPDGLQKAEKSKGGIFLVDKGSESTDSEKVLQGHRKDNVELVAKHLDDIFSQISKAH